MAVYTFPEVRDIIQDITVIRQMDAAWNRMVTTASATARYEYGFYIYYSHTFRSFSVGHIEQGLPTLGCVGTNARIALGIVTSNIECCAFFHCHTTLHFCPIGASRDTGPSPSDRNFARDWNLPGILYDYASFRIEGGHPINDRHKIYKFGPRKRPDMPY